MDGGNFGRHMAFLAAPSKWRVKAEREATSMQFFLGVVYGVLLTVFAVFFADAVVSATAPAGTQAENIVNWDVAGKRVASSIDVIREAYAT
jgi:hypothetical protein